MTDDNSNLVDIPEDLSAFKAVFEGKAEAPEVDGEDTEVDALATDEDEDASAETEDEAEDQEDVEGEDTEDSDAADGQEDEDEEEPEPEDKGKKRKSDYQSRINELTRARREAERREAALLARLEALEGVARKDNSTPQESIKDHLPQGAPTPDALDEKGEPKYPLGEFDPQFIVDLTSYSIESKTREIEARKAQEAEAVQLAAAQAALRNQWADKLEAYEEEVPEVREHIEDLVDTFQNVDPAYGEYLAMTIMQCENGPAIMEYLSQNIGEAQNIVASGPAAATRAIGRLEARLSKPARPAEEKRNKKRISESAPPPSKTVRGSSRGQVNVRPDTTDLAAFKRDFGF